MKKHFVRFGAALAITAGLTVGCGASHPHCAIAAGVLIERGGGGGGGFSGAHASFSSGASSARSSISSGFSGSSSSAGSARSSSSAGFSGSSSGTRAKAGPGYSGSAATTPSTSYRSSSGVSTFKGSNGVTYHVAVPSRVGSSYSYAGHMYVYEPRSYWVGRSMDPFNPYDYRNFTNPFSPFYGYHMAYSGHC